MILSCIPRKLGQAIWSFHPRLALRNPLSGATSPRQFERVPSHVRDQRRMFRRPDQCGHQHIRKADRRGALQ